MTPCARTSSASGSPTSSRSVGTTSAAPEVSAMHSSQNEASKLGEANWRTRARPSTPRWAAWVAARLLTPWWVTTTPFG
ncbi:hypothetical protein E1258_14880, partial [Micromonospora sp. KC207]